MSTTVSSLSPLPSRRTRSTEFMSSPSPLLRNPAQRRSVCRRTKLPVARPGEPAFWARAAGCVLSRRCRGRQSRLGGPSDTALHGLVDRYAAGDLCCGDPLHRRRCLDCNRDADERGVTRTALRSAPVRIADDFHHDCSRSSLHNCQRVAERRGLAELVLHLGDAGAPVAWHRCLAAVAMADRSWTGVRHQRIAASGRRLTCLHVDQRHAAVLYDKLAGTVLPLFITTTPLPGAE